MKELSDLVNHYIQLRNISPKELAAKSGVSYTYISYIKNNNFNGKPDENTISIICDALEMTPADKEKAIYHTALNKTPETIKKVIERIRINGAIPEGRESECEGFYRMQIFENLIISKDGKSYSFPDHIGTMSIPILKKTSAPLFAIPHHGKEMEPKYQEGMYLIIHEGILPLEGKTGLYIINGKLALREFHKDANGNPVLFCLNKDFPPNVGDFPCIGSIFLFLGD